MTTPRLPAGLFERYRDRFVAMPILSPRVRSLNLSTSVAIALYDQEAQVGGLAHAMLPKPLRTRRPAAAGVWLTATSNT